MLHFSDIYSGNDDNDKDTCDKFGIAALVKKRDELDDRLTKLYRESEELYTEEQSAQQKMKDDEMKWQQEEKGLLKAKTAIMAALIKLEV